MNRRPLSVGLCISGALIAMLSNIILIPNSDNLPDWFVIIPPVIGAIMVFIGIFILMRKPK